MRVSMIGALSGVVLAGAGVLAPLGAVVGGPAPGAPRAAPAKPSAAPSRPAPSPPGPPRERTAADASGGPSAATPSPERQRPAADEEAAECLTSARTIRIPHVGEGRRQANGLRDLHVWYEEVRLPATCPHPAAGGFVPGYGSGTFPGSVPTQQANPPGGFRLGGGGAGGGAAAERDHRVGITTPQDRAPVLTPVRPPAPPARVFVP